MVKITKHKKQGTQRPTIIATDDTIHQIVKEEISKYGNAADLNHLDVSRVTDMACLFRAVRFQGNISQWDVSNVTDMSSMFYNSLFNGDISKWNVFNVTNMSGTFERSRFDGDISKWNVSSVMNMSYMFDGSSFNGDLSDWSLHGNCDVDRMLRKIKNPILLPLLRLDSIDDYQEKLEMMFSGVYEWRKNIPQTTRLVTPHHGVLLLLLQDQSPNIIHPTLTGEDAQKLQLLYQLTGSVYQSVNAWIQQRNNAVPMLNSSIASALSN